MSDLRNALETIVNGGSVSVSDHPARIAAISSKFPHSIEHIQESTGRPYNCFMLALGLLDNDCVFEILKKDADCYGLAGVKVGTEYMSRLIESGALVKDDAGEVVIYFRDGEPVHAGLIKGGRVRSKWGIGNLWEHACWEVPSSYGDKAEKYTITDEGALEAAFESYAAELVAAKGGYPD